MILNTTISANVATMYINVRYIPNSKVKNKNSSEIGINLEKFNTSSFDCIDSNEKKKIIKIFKIHKKNLLLKPDRNDREEGMMNRLLKIRTNIILLNS